jgi:hypothetical protein
MKEVSFPKWTLVAAIGVLLVLIGPIPEWASNTGLLSRMGGFGDSLAVMLNFILRFFLVLIGGSIATITLIGEGVRSHTPHRIIVGVIFTLVMIYIFFESPRRVWAGNQDAPLTWSLGLIAYFIAVWDMMKSNLHPQSGRFLIPLGIAIGILGWINLVDLLACPSGCRAWALESGVAFGVYAVVIGGVLLVISRLWHSKINRIVAYTLIGLYCMALLLSMFFFSQGL